MLPLCGQFARESGAMEADSNRLLVTVRLESALSVFRGLLSAVSGSEEHSRKAALLLLVGNKRVDLRRRSNWSGQLAARCVTVLTLHFGLGACMNPRPSLANSL